MPPKPVVRLPPLSLLSLLASAGLIALAVLLGHALLPLLPASSLMLVLLVAVLASAALFGVWAGVLAALMAMAAYNFFFIEPLFTLHVARAEDVLMLAAFLFAALLTGWLTGRLREQSDAARRRAGLIERSAAFGAALGAAGDEAEVVATLVDHLANLSERPAFAMRDDGGRPQLVCASPRGFEPGLEDDQAAARCIARRSRELAAAPGWNGSRFDLLPLAGVDAGLLAIGVAMPQSLPDYAAAIEAMLGDARTACERLRLAREAAQARQSADKATLRAALLSSLSHDLHTPLAAILGSVTSLIEFGPRLDDAARDDLLGAIEEETRRLSRYVGNLLDMTRLNSGVTPKSTLLEPLDVLNAAAERGRRSFPRQTIAINAEDHVPLVKGDALLLEQCLFNLIDNAARHSPAGEAIIISLARDGAAVTWRVIDSGPGISAADAARIFEPFVRTSTARGDGAGLGLSICRGIMTALGGSVRLEPTPSGACFAVSLPIATEEAA